MFGLVLKYLFEIDTIVMWKCIPQQIFFSGVDVRKWKFRFSWFVGWIYHNHNEYSCWLYRFGCFFVMIFINQPPWNFICFPFSMCFSAFCFLFLHFWSFFFINSKILHVHHQMYVLSAWLMYFFTPSHKLFSSLSNEISEKGCNIYYANSNKCCYCTLNTMILILLLWSW